MTHSRIPIQGFAVIVGEGNHATGTASCAAFAVDGVLPQCVIFPRSEGEVSRALKHAADHDLAVIPCRNTTKISFGNIPSAYDVALSLKEMNRVQHFEPADLTASVEPGMELGGFQQLLAPHGLWLPLDPPGNGRASLGGIVASNAAGPLRLRYGTPRDFVLGMKIATTDGKTVKTGGRVVKNVAGYDLSRLLTGSYGTLGVIVEISFKLFPLPAGRSSWCVGVSSLDRAREFRRSILQSPLGPLRMVLLDAGASSFARGHEVEPSSGAYEIWIELGGSERVLARSAQSISELAEAASASACTLSPESAEAGWNQIADFATHLSRRHPGLVILRATLPIASGEGFVKLAAAEAEKMRARHACFCQNGVGIVRACLIPGEASSGLISSVVRLRDEAKQRGGTLVVEECPVEMKKEIDVWGQPGSDFALMSKLKELWDPKRTLSPGRFVGGL